MHFYNPSVETVRKPDCRSSEAMNCHFFKVQYNALYINSLHNNEKSVCIQPPTKPINFAIETRLNCHRHMSRLPSRRINFAIEAYIPGTETTDQWQEIPSLIRNDDKKMLFFYLQYYHSVQPVSVGGYSPAPACLSNGNKDDRRMKYNKNRRRGSVGFLSHNSDAIRFTELHTFSR